MNYSETNRCVTCGARILDDTTALECVVCRTDSHLDEDSESRISWQPPTYDDTPEKDQKSSTWHKWVLVWFVTGLIWYLFELAELKTDRDDWLLYIEALRPESYGEFGIKTLGVSVAGSLVVSRVIPVVTTLLMTLIKYFAIGVAVFIGFAIVMNPTVWTKIEGGVTDVIASFSKSPDDNDLPVTTIGGRITDEDGSLANTEFNSGGLIESKNRSSIALLRKIMLDQINVDRVKHGVDPVVLSSNSAAQDHANDMLVFGYLGHWRVDGRKPYMEYSQAGGTSYVAENVAAAGHRIAGYINNDCSSFLSLCEKLVPAEQLTNLQYRMMYDDAESDWGHRETMLDPRHREVSIGIAFDDEFIALVQHFSGGAARALEGPTLVDNRLSMKIELVEPELKVFESIQIWWEPLPIPREPEDIGALRSYCVGGDFTAECGEPIFIVLPPPPDGKRYLDLIPTDIVASNWVIKLRWFRLSEQCSRFYKWNRATVYQAAAGVQRFDVELVWGHSTEG